MSDTENQSRLLGNLIKELIFQPFPVEDDDDIEDNTNPSPADENLVDTNLEVLENDFSMAPFAIATLVETANQAHLELRAGLKGLIREVLISDDNNSIKEEFNEATQKKANTILAAIIEYFNAEKEDHSLLKKDPRHIRLLKRNFFHKLHWVFYEIHAGLSDRLKSNPPSIGEVLSNKEADLLILQYISLHLFEIATHHDFDSKTKMNIEDLLKQLEKIYFPDPNAPLENFDDEDDDDENW